MNRIAARLTPLPFALLLAATVAGQNTSKPTEAKQSPAKSAQKHMVRFSFKQGTVRHSVLEMNMLMTINMGAEDIETKVQTKMWQTTTVKAAKGNTADIEQLLTRIKCTSQSLLMKVNYDSDDDETDAGQMAGLEELVGETTAMKLTDQGKVSDIKVPDAAQEMQASGIDLNELIKSIVTQLPDHPIAIGETWQVKQEIPIGDLGKADGVMQYKLLAIDKKTITLQQKLVLDTSKLQMPGVKGFTMMTEGTSRLDLMTGTPIEMDMTSKTEMHGAMTMNMVMRQRITPAAAPKKLPAKPEAGKQVQTGKQVQPAKKAEPQKIGK